MISKLKVLVMITGLVWGPLICTGHGQQRQTETRSVQVIGLAGLKENTKGKLTVVNGTLRFVHAKGYTEVAAAAIDDVVTGKDSQRIVGGTFGTVASFAAPYGSGILLVLLRKKVDILTIQYRDADGGLHGAIFTMPRGKADTIKKELVARGARTSEPNMDELVKSLADSQEKKR